MDKNNKASILRIILIVLFGWTGWQRFEKKKYLSGFVFLFTGGLFLVGWVLDAYSLIKENKIKYLDF